MRHIFSIGIWLVFCHALHAESQEAQSKGIYIYHDESVTVFTDMPRQKNDVPADISPLQTYQPPLPSTRNNPKSYKPIVQKPIREYQAQIKSPKPEETIWSGSGDIKVKIHVNKLLKGEIFQLKLDDKVVASGYESGTFDINNIYRGTRVLQVDILNRKKEIVYTSKAVTFYMHRPFK